MAASRIREYKSHLEALFIKHKKTIIQFMLFCAVWAIGTAVNIGITSLLTEKAGMRYIYSALLGQLVGITINFFLNKVVTFSKRTWNIWKQYLFSLMSYSIGIAVYLFLLYIYVDILHFWYIFAIFLSLPIVVIFNFITHKLLVFNK